MSQRKFYVSPKVEVTLVTIAKHVLWENSYIDMGDGSDNPDARAEQPWTDIWNEKDNTNKIEEDL